MKLDELERLRIVIAYTIGLIEVDAIQFRREFRDMLIRMEVLTKHD